MNDKINWHPCYRALDIISKDLPIRHIVLELVALAQEGGGIRGKASQFVSKLTEHLGEDSTQNWLVISQSTNDRDLPVLVFNFLVSQFDLLLSFDINELETIVEELDMGLLLRGKKALSTEERELILEVGQKKDAVSESVAQQIRGAAELAAKKRGLKLLWYKDGRVCDGYFLVKESGFTALKDTEVDAFHSFEEPVFVVNEAQYMDQVSVASNPGDVHVKFIHWAFRNIKVRWLLILLLWSIGSAFRVHLGLLVIPLFLAWIVRKRWLEHSEYFQFGCVCPAVIVSTQPLLMAVHTNLEREIEYPAIKVIDIAQFGGNLLNIGKGKFSIGDRLPTISVYVDDDTVSTHWIDFYPHPVALATGDRLLIAQRLESIDEEDWDKLEQWIAQNNSFSEGLYPLDNNEERVLH